MNLQCSYLIDVAKAQELMGDYHAVTGIPTGFIDGEGKVWTATFTMIPSMPIRLAPKLSYSSPAGPARSEQGREVDKNTWEAVRE